jgi:hypothetical protein
MLALTRTRLLDVLSQVPTLVDAYADHDARYADRAVRWLSDVENVLGSLRHPLVSSIASQRANLLAVDEGLTPPEIRDPPRSRRKLKRVAASLILRQAVSDLKQIVDDIDREFDGAREKLAQLLAVATRTKPIPLPPREPRKEWLDEVWSGLAINGESAGMFQYLASRLTAADRRFLLDEVLFNLLENTAAHHYKSM